MDTYNGWKNWATWNVALWLGNDEHLYFISRRFAYYKDLVEHLKLEYGFESTPDGAKYNDPDIDEEALDAWLLEE